MKLWFAISLLALSTTAVSSGWAQPMSPASVFPLEGGRALTDEEAHAFDARLRAAGTDQTRAKITKERDDLVRARLVQRAPNEAIPAGRHEASGDLVMSDVPTPEFDQRGQMTSQPAGAFAPMTTGSNPFGRPVSDP